MNVRQKQLLEMLDISLTTLWRMIKRDEFLFLIWVIYVS